jgi:hypothetical protein
MRLTLRTMLAYLDDILEPGDAQDIAKKIEESEFATGLMHRVRDVTRRLRLAAPKLEGRGMGLDPNTVAEYLDNTLPGDRVPDFEKVCLESDVHLAEVASGHQILTLVLGEPAEIDPQLRERMYHLLDAQQAAAAKATIAAAHGEVAHAPAAPAHQPEHIQIDTSGGKHARKKLEVPEYLREGGPRMPAAQRMAVAAVLLVLGGVGIVAFANKDKISDWLNPPTEVAEGEKSHPPVVPPEVKPSVKPDSTVTDEEPPGDMPEIKLPPARPVVGEGSATKLEPPIPPPATVSTTTGGSPPVKPVEPVVVVKPEDKPKPPEATPVTPVMPDDKSVATNMPKDKEPVPPQPGPPEQAVTPPPVVPEGIGRLISEREVLLRYDVPSQTWKRLATRATLFAGDRLLSLPTYRSNLALSAGVNLQMLGGTTVELAGADAQGVPAVRLVQGRLIMLTPGKPGASVRIMAGTRQGTIVFGDGDSMAAVEVKHERVEGTNPETDPAVTVIDIYSTSGEIRWLDGSSAPPKALKAPAYLSLNGASAPAGEDSTPNWVKADERSPIEKRASADVEEALGVDRPISLGLKELAGDRRTEISSLAVQCLAQIGEFDAFVNSLNDAAQRASWNNQVEALRDAIAESPATASQVYKALERHRTAKGAELFRLLWGYSPDQLQAGAAAQLVKYLDHEDLDFRVLAFWNLQHITGSTLYYRPEFTAAKRTPHVRAWQQKLASGQLIPK